MKLAIISFTSRGNELNCLLTETLQKPGYNCQGYIPERFFKADQNYKGMVPVRISVQEWVQRSFQQTDALIFIGAAGIAVRMIAPHLRHKSSDPAVVVLDDAGQFVISLLSGHLGGANELTEWIAGELGAVPVITTATDVNHKFSVDLFAKKNNLLIADWSLIKQISASVLEDQPVGFYCDLPISGAIPDGFTQTEICPNNVWITYKQQVNENSLISAFITPLSRILQLVPKVVVLGIGCRKGITYEVINQVVSKVLRKFNINPNSVNAIASIDLKQHEEGVRSLAKSLGVPYETYSASELQTVEGAFTESFFVQEVTGVGNVCERAALYHAAKQGKEDGLIIRKQAEHGVTVAAALIHQKIVVL